MYICLPICNLTAFRIATPCELVDRLVWVPRRHHISMCLCLRLKDLGTIDLKLCCLAHQVAQLVELLPLDQKGCGMSPWALPNYHISRSLENRVRLIDVAFLLNSPLTNNRNPDHYSNH